MASQINEYDHLQFEKYVDCLNDDLFDLFNNFAELGFRELLILSSKNLKHGDNSGHFLPVSGFLIAISLALIVSSASLVDLFGWVSVDIK